jgi:hypothetical protein
MTPSRTTITRQQLRDAIEAGITRAQEADHFTAEHATALRAVADGASVVARSTFKAHNGELCPVAQAVSGWPDEDWHGLFTEAYDRATYEAIDQRIGVCVLHITDNDDSTEGGA